jgi:glycosyltransferase involved in cell wall biosynthesis
MIDVSVVIPWNGSPFLNECLSSLHSSDIHLFDFEILVIVPKRFEHKHPRGLGIRVINQDGVGLANALNLGLSLSRGEFIFRLDADDLCSSNRFSLQIKALRASPNLIAIGGQLEKFNTNLGHQRVYYPITKNLTRFLLPYLSPLPHPGLAFKRKAVEFGIKYDESLALCEDWDFIFQLSRLGDLNNLKSVVGFYRIHDNQISNNLNFLDSYSIMVLKKNSLKSKFVLNKFWVNSYSYPDFNYYTRLYLARTRIKRNLNLRNSTFLIIALCYSPLKFLATFYLYVLFYLQRLFLKISTQTKN